MRIFMSLLVLIGVGTFAFSQSDGIIVPEIDMDSRYNRVYNSNHGTILLTDSEAHLVETATGSIKKIKSKDIACKNCQPIFGRYISNDSLYLYWMKLGLDSLEIISSVHIKNGPNKVIHRDTLDSPKAYCAFTKAKLFEDNYYLCLTCDSVGTSPNLFALLKFPPKERMQILGMEKSTGFGPTSGIFHLRYVKDIEIMEFNRILVSGNFSHFLFLGTFDLDELDFGVVKYFDSTLNEEIWSWDPYMSKVSKNQVVGTCNYPFRASQGFEEHFLRISVVQDSFIVDTLLRIPNPEKVGKFGGKNVYLGNEVVMTFSNEDLLLTSDKSNIPCSFYISRVDDDETKWHKSFGGDYYYRVKDIEQIDSCKIAIAGSVHNYYNNDLLQGFYAIFDCDGELITSNTDLKLVETSVFPNPTTGLVHFSEDTFEGAEAIIYSADGKRLLKLMIKNRKIDVSALSAGWYALQIQTDEGLFSQKIIITK